MTILEGFHLVPNKSDDLYWNPVAAVICLVAGVILVGTFIQPFLPALLRAPLRLGGREAIGSVHVWAARTLVLGAVGLAYGVGYFFKDLGYAVITAVLGIAYWLAVVRPSQGGPRAKDGFTSA